MSKQVVKTQKAPLPIGPYSQAIKVDGLVFVSGQIPLLLDTSEVCGGGITEQTRLVLTYLSAVLEEAGSSLKKVIKTTVFLKDMNDFASMNKVYAEFFSGDQPPARAAVEVSRLPKDVLVEIEAVSVV